MMIHNNLAKIGAGLAKRKGLPAPTTQAGKLLESAQGPAESLNLKAQDARTRELFDEFRFVESNLAQAPSDGVQGYFRSNPDRKFTRAVASDQRLKVSLGTALSIGGLPGLTSALFRGGVGPAIHGFTHRNPSGEEVSFNALVSGEGDATFIKRTEGVKQPVYLKATPLEDDKFRTETILDKNGVLFYDEEVVDTKGKNTASFFKNRVQDQFGL